jgi:hypothetical protein
MGGDMAIRRLRAIFILQACIPCLLGCAVVDQYSGRAVTYNLEAEQAGDQAILLNIVRAYLRRPMQFTTVSTITGTASAGGGVGYTWPINVPFRPPINGTSIAQFPPVNTWTFNSSISGGPTFTVPVLDTQEFYRGILSPIPGQLYDLYTQSGYPHEALFNLFVQRVVMIRKSCKAKDHLPNCEYDFLNYPGDDTDLQPFQALGDYLYDLGLSSEATPAQDIQFVHPVNINLRLVGASPLGGSSASTSGSAVGSAESSASGENQSKKYGFCFSPRKPEYIQYVRSQYVCETPSDAPQPALATSGEAKAKETFRIKPSGEATGVVVASKDFINRLKKVQHPLGQDLDEFAGQEVYLSFYLRSVEGMFYYLGEVARRASDHPEFDAKPATVFIKEHVEQTGALKSGLCTSLGTPTGCAPLFVVRANLAPSPDDFLSVFYDGRRFAVPSTDEGGGTSSQVLEIIKQLLALNSSAKSLPQSNVVSVIGQ